MTIQIEQLKTEIKQLKTERDALARWMQEVTNLLIYSPENPMDYKTGVVETFATYRAAIGKPLRRDA